MALVRWEPFEGLTALRREAGVPLWGVRTYHRLTCARAGREGDCPTQGRCPRSHHAEERSGTSQAHPHPGILTPQRQAAAGSQPRRLGCAERGQSHPGCNL
jgi:hypothetical protein